MKSSDNNVCDSAITVVQRLYRAYNLHDIPAVLACWRPDGVEFLPLVGEMRVADELGKHLKMFFGAFPDARSRIDSVVADDKGNVAAQITLSGTFTGTHFNGLRANGRPWVARMAEFFTTSEGLITRMDAYMDGMDLAQQLRLLPPPGRFAERMMRRTFNLKIGVGDLLRGSRRTIR